MKKTFILILTAMLAVSAAGCRKIGMDIIQSADSQVSSSEASDISDSDETEDEADGKGGKVTNKKSYKKVYITNPNKKDDSSKDSESDKDDDENKNEANVNQDYYDSENNAYSADAIYRSAVNMYRSVVMGCPYRLNYDDTDANGFAAIDDSSVSGTSDVVSEYCSVFAEPDSYIYEKYIEKDGKVYCNDATRGSNIYYTGTELEYVSGDENSMTFNAVSHYRDPETGEDMGDRSAAFSVKLTDDGYKVTEFKYPE